MSRLKYFTVIFAVSAAVTFVLPLAAVKLISGDKGMAVCLLLFYAAAPMLALAVGVNAGRRLRSRFLAPVIPAAVFLISMWILFDLGESAFILYAAVYLAIGAAAMLVRSLFK